MQNYWQGNYGNFGFTTAPVAPVVEQPKPPLKVKLTPRERGVYSNFLAKADPDNRNRVEGQQAVEFFKRSGLPVDILKTIWNICTPNDESFLDRERFYVALRLIALAQDGKPATEQSIYDDIQANLPKFQSAVPVKDKWDIESADMEKYIRAFSQIAGAKGYLTTEEAFTVFSKTQVKQDYLKKIWNLSDPFDTAEFRENQFVVAMHLISRLKNFNEPVPDELPLPLKKIITKSDQSHKEPTGVLSSAPADQFAEFGLGALKPTNLEASSAELKKTDMGFGLGPAMSFQTLPVKSNLEENKGSMSSMGSLNIDFSMNTASTVNTMNTLNTGSVFNPVNIGPTVLPPSKSQAEVKNPEIAKEKINENLIGFAAPRKKSIETKEPVVVISARNSIGAGETARRDEDLTDMLEKLEQKIQKKFTELREIRTKISLEKEKNQMLTSRLHEAYSKQLISLSQVILSVNED